jgi:hypothetical protein
LLHYTKKLIQIRKTNEVLTDRKSVKSTFIDKVNVVEIENEKWICPVDEQSGKIYINH